MHWISTTRWTRGAIYPGASVLGSVLAVCGSFGGRSGRDVLSAAALGLEVSCPIALACTLDRGWHRSASGVFGATAASKLISLRSKQMLNAFGITYGHAAGNRQCIRDSTTDFAWRQNSSSVVVRAPRAEVSMPFSKEWPASRIRELPLTLVAAEDGTSTMTSAILSPGSSPAISRPPPAIDTERFLIPPSYAIASRLPGSSDSVHKAKDMSCAAPRAAYI
jgi:hypothetical protein